MPSLKLVSLCFPGRCKPLEALVPKRTASQSQALPAQLVLACAEGSRTTVVTAVAARLGVSPEMARTRPAAGNFWGVCLEWHPQQRRQRRVGTHLISTLLDPGSLTCVIVDHNSTLIEKVSKLADEDLDLGERDDSQENEFPPSDRLIHTQAYDLSINTLKEQWDDGTLIIPDFQREYVWDNAKASRLIESLLLNIPIPVLFFAETADANYQIVDGHQRVYTVVRYLDNQFPLSGLRIQAELRGLRYHQLPDREQRFLRTRVMRAIIIGADSSPSMKFEVFERLNTGGLSLNAQEVRHGLNMGAFSDLLSELQGNRYFRESLNIPKPRKRMVDQELILRFFALRDRLPQYRTPLVRFLNEYMQDNRSPSEAWIAERRNLFIKTMRLISVVMPGTAFRVTDTSGQSPERVINRALFEAQTVIFSVCDESQAESNAPALRASLASLFGDNDFNELIRRATGDRFRALGRIRDTANAFERAGVAIDLSLLGPVTFPARQR